ncbi:sugar ABC transporter permease [Neobacillus sp. MM2021_6]|uniref:carbohydrate ABC transporter permease n=1 Tax=Bacillaceae TaxID=186817 RepID=UPI00140A55F3|nr:MULTISPECIES: sugar ABC transporter permease [Bacillaceae]MBO0959906.1 sugar ABC transporter permease [Neobacillus sp. MM2021_6]NHC18854.1 sugar ABC transporter permease [Bacillus sp. MM2020_4]
MRPKVNKIHEVTGWSLTSPYLIYSLVFFLIPLGWAFYMSFTDWNLISPVMEWIGVQNYNEAFFDEGVRAAFFVTFKFLFMYIPLVLCLSLLLATLVNALPRYKSIFIIGYFLPYLASGVASSIVVRGVLSYDSPLNIWLRETWNLNIDWLNSEQLTPIIIVLMMVWKFGGYYALILIAGLESIPKDVYEAALIDGVTKWKQLWKITLPLLYPALFTVTILAIGVVFHIFTEPYVLTNGGPNLSTNTWYIEIYNEAFNKLNTGYGATIAIFNAIVTFLSISIFKKIFEKWGAKNGW